MPQSVYPQSGTENGARSADLAEAIRADERRQGRPHTARERAAFVAGFIEASASLAAWSIR